MASFIHHSTLLGVIAGATVLFAGLIDARAENHFSLGVEGFRDRYSEPDVEVDTHTDYGSVTAGYRHDYNGFFSALDGRYSEGSADYKSPSGVLNGNSQYEGEVRFRSGIDISIWHGILMPYIGIGSRWYYDKGKGTFTNLGAEAYDRHITQFYAPLGTSFQFTSGKWVFTPNVEVDPLLWGRVSSHLGEVPPSLVQIPPNPPFLLPNFDTVNRQHRGIGFRSEFMVGQQYQYFRWEFGPFLRYWSISQSDISSSIFNSPYGSILQQGAEPQNTRLQYGLALRLTY